MKKARGLLVVTCVAVFLGFPILPLAHRAAAQSALTFQPRQKLEDFVKNPAKLASLKRGIAAMKARKPSDPTSWFYQAAVHAVTPEAIEVAKRSDPAVGDVNQARFWNQCPHANAYNSAEFLVWHRAYLYYFERILRTASGDPTFSLPYWNYTERVPLTGSSADETTRSFPPQFADADTDPATQLPRNPLYDHRREQAFAFGLYELSEPTAGTRTIFAETDFFGASEDTGFAGGVADNNSRTRGRIEQQPHDLIHFAIGGAIGTGENDIGDNATAGLMASVQTAALDPIFWVHHSNIDRLWTVWECLTDPPRRWGNVPPRDWLNASPWFFNDSDKSVQNQPRLFYLLRRNLPVSYDSDVATCSPLSSTDPTRNEPSVERAAAPVEAKSFTAKGEAGRIVQTFRISPDEKQTFSIPLKAVRSLGNLSLKDAILSAPKNTPRRLVVEVKGLKLEGVTSVGFDVYVNLAPNAKPERSVTNYVGTISMFGADHAHGHDDGHEGQTQQFDITKLVTSENFNAEKVTVTIVPFDLLTPKAGQPRLRRSVGIRYSEIGVLVLERS